MMQAPSTYAEWMQVLDMFAARMNDEQTIPAMQQGAIEWQSGVAPRLVQAINQALDARFDALNNRFRTMRKSNQLGDLHRALRYARSEFSTMYAGMDIAGIPEEHRGALRESVRKAADDMQESLENSVRSQMVSHQLDESSGGRILTQIRQTPVNRF